MMFLGGEKSARSYRASRDKQSGVAASRTIFRVVGEQVLARVSILSFALGLEGKISLGGESL